MSKGWLKKYFNKDHTVANTTLNIKLNVVQLYLTTEVSYQDMVNVGETSTLIIVVYIGDEKSELLNKKCMGK